MRESHSTELDQRRRALLVSSIFTTGVGTAASRMGLILTFLAASDSLFVTGLIVVVDSLPRALLARPIGKVLRRLGTRGGIVVGLLGEAGLTLAIIPLVAGPAWSILLLLLARTIFSTLGLVGLQASVPTLFSHPTAVLRTNFFVGLASAAAISVGPLIGVALLDASSLQWLLILDAVTSSAAAFGLYRYIPRYARWQGGAETESSYREGLMPRLARRPSELSRGLLANSAAVAAGGVMNVVLPIYIVNVLQMSNQRASLTLGAFGVGAMLVTLVGATARNITHAGGLVRYGLALQVLGFALFAARIPGTELWVAVAGAGSALRAMGALGWVQAYDSERVPENVAALHGSMSTGLVGGTMVGVFALGAVSWSPVYAVALSVIANLLSLGQFAQEGARTSNQARSGS